MSETQMIEDPGRCAARPGEHLQAETGTVSSVQSGARGMKIITIHFYPDRKVEVLKGGGLDLSSESSFWLRGLQEGIQPFQASFLDKIFESRAGESQ